MPRAATLSAAARKKAVSTRSARTPLARPALKVVPGRRPRVEAAKPAPKPAAPASVTYNKNDLLKRFAPLVRHVVERVAATLPRNVDHEDLYSAGVLGLLDAHAKFDTRKGVKFETYAVWRIKGAVLDQLRALDWASRSMRRKARNLDGVTRKLDQKLGRAASEEEERKVVVLRTLNHLPEQERLVVALYYYEHLTLKEIGRALGISESRVSQVHTRAMSRLRLRLQHALDADA